MRYLLLAAALCAACDGSPTQPDTVAAGVPFELKVGESAVSGGVRVRFDAVRSDSRCPLDANCIRAGEAVIALALSSPGTAGVLQEVQTDPPDRRSITYRDTVITLSSLQPYPRSDRPTRPDDYVATLVASAR